MVAAVVDHIDVTKFSELDGLLNAMGKTSFSARDLATAVDTFDRALEMSASRLGIGPLTQLEPRQILVYEIAEAKEKLAE